MRSQIVLTNIVSEEKIELSDFQKFCQFAHMPYFRQFPNLAKNTLPICFLHRWQQHNEKNIIFNDIAFQKSIFCLIRQTLSHMWKP